MKRLRALLAKKASQAAAKSAPAADATESRGWVKGGGVGAEGEESFFQLGVVFSTVNGSFGGLSSAEPQVGGTTGG